MKLLVEIVSSQFKYHGSSKISEARVLHAALDLQANEEPLLEASEEFRYAEELEPFASGLNFSLPAYKILSAEGLTPGMFLNSRLDNVVALQDTYESLLASSINISSSDTNDAGVLPPGVLGKFRARKIYEIDIHKVLKEIEKRYYSARRYTHAMKDNANSSAEGLVFETLDYATCSASIKFFGGKLGMLNPNEPNWFQNLAALATHMFMSGFPATTAHRIIHIQLINAQGSPIQGPRDTSHRVTEQMVIKREHNKRSVEWV